MSSPSEQKDEFSAGEFDDPSIAKARGVKKLSGGAEKGSNVRVLSNLANDAQVFRLNAQFLISDLLPNYFGFLNKGALTELELRASLPRKKGKRGRDDVVDVVKEHLQQAAGGVGSAIRGFINR